LPRIGQRRIVCRGAIVDIGSAMEDKAKKRRERLLDPIDRVSEILFGLIMAVTIIGALSIAAVGRNEVRTVLFAALGCNLAWGLVDAVMYLVRTLTERTRNRMLAREVIGVDPETARALIAATLPEHVAAISGPAELDAMHRRLIDLPPPARPALGRDDYLRALGIFLLVVAATFPVAAPFLLTTDAALAMRLSQIVALLMLFGAGVVLGRHAGQRHPVRTGLAMAVLGALLIAAVKALGG
jgi:VIT1/CCC1 family predicted Fe2+/Mn2+ transporter